MNAEENTPRAYTDDVRDEQPSIGSCRSDDHQVATTDDTNDYSNNSYLSEYWDVLKSSVGVDTEWNYENNTEPNVKQDVENVKERRFAEAEQVCAVYE